MRKLLLYLLVTAILSACGSPPLVLPESASPTEEMATASEVSISTEAIEQEEVAATGETSSTSTEVIEQTVTPEPFTPTVTSTTNTPVATVEQNTPVVPEPSVPLPPPTLYPTPALSPTPTPTFEPLSDKPIGGYVFSPPELLFTTSESVELIQWIPDNNKKILLVTNRQLIEVLDIKTGYKHQLAKTDCCVIGKPVWLSATQQISYLFQPLQNGTLGEVILYLGNVEVETSRSISPPLIPSFDNNGVLVFDEDKNTLQNVSQNIEKVQVTLEESLPTIESGPFSHYQASWNDQSDWIAYYNKENLILLNPKANQKKPLNLNSVFGSQEKLSVSCTAWSPNGKKLAFIIGVGDNIPLLFTKMGVFDTATNEIQVIEDNVVYTTDIAWSPDSKHILMEGVTGFQDGFEKRAVFLVNISTGNVYPVPVMPDDALGGSSCNGLAWSPNGEAVILSYGTVTTTSQIGWYRVNVSSP